MIKFFYYLSLLSLLSSCYTISVFTNTNSICNYNIKNMNESREIISIDRGACFGTCPIYLISISSDMNGVYYGKQFVDITGKIKFKLSEEEIKSILKKANEIKFCELEDEYSENISDLPKTYIQIFDKKILDYYGAPKELKELEELIDKICFKHIK
tara:strand:+ start:503 stop:970 length:468 start_codon:yes stop_codon:yes gene_type:complete